MSKWNKVFKQIATFAVVYFSTGNPYYAATASTKKARNTAKGVYDNYTGHYGRQQKRLAEGQQKADIIEQEEQRKYALAQRKVMIDEQRERMGVGVKYKTSTRFEQKGKAKPKETLG